MEKEKSLAPMSLEELNERIDKSMDDSKNGRFTSSSELKAEIEEWGF